MIEAASINDLEYAPLGLQSSGKRLQTSMHHFSRLERSARQQIRFDQEHSNRPRLSQEFHLPIAFLSLALITRNHTTFGPFVLTCSGRLVFDLGNASAIGQRVANSHRWEGVTKSKARKESLRLAGRSRCPSTDLGATRRESGRLRNVGFYGWPIIP